MNNTATGQFSGRSENRCSHWQIAVMPDMRPACGQKFRPGYPVDSTAYATAMMQPGTGSIHDNVTTEPGDIVFSDIQHNPGFSSRVNDVFPDTYSIIPAIVADNKLTSDAP